MLIAVIIALYILGCALTYLYFRKLTRRKFNRDWLLIERIIVIGLSLFSWLAIIAFLIFVSTIIIADVNPDKEVKW